MASRRWGPWVGNPDQRSAAEVSAARIGRAAVRRARVFVLVAGNLRGSEIAAVFLKALPRIYKILALRSGPFVARITKAGEIGGV